MELVISNAERRALMGESLVLPRVGSIYARCRALRASLSLSEGEMKA